MKYCFIILLLLASAALAQGQNMNSGNPAAANYYQQLPYEQVNGKIIIEAEVGGHKRKFFLDTGAPCQVSEAVANDLGIKDRQQSQITDAYGNTGSLAIAYVASIKLGSTVFNNIPALIGIPDFLKCFNIDGIIGSNLLRNSIIQFDNAKKMITITDDVNRLALNAKNAIPLKTHLDKQSSPFFVADMGMKAKGEFLFDTGESGFMILSDNYMSIFKRANSFQTVSTGYGANGFGANGAEKNSTKYRLKFPLISIGGTMFKDVLIETSHNDGANGNRIGAKLLDYGTVTLDYKHGKLYIDPLQPQADLSEKSWPVSPMYANGKLIIGVVWEKLKNTVKPGLQIVNVDGADYQQVDICTLITQKPLLYGKTHATLTLKDEKGKTTVLDLTKE